jgi:hypothetical protein
MTDKPKTIDVDLTLFDTGKPHWLSPQGKRPDIFERNRAKYRALAQARKKMDKIAGKMDEVDTRLKDRTK